jgi:SAM-dependent methyltransferase
LEPAPEERVLIRELDVKDWHPTRWPRFDVILLVEVSEFLSDFDEVVAKAARSLVPGGLFLLTKPPDSIAWLFFGRKQVSWQFRRILRRSQFDNLAIVPWWRRYDVVYAWKVLGEEVESVNPDPPQISESTH